MKTDTCKIPTKQCIYILCNFNARVASDHASSPCHPGQHGVRSENEKWTVLELHAECYLCITNTNFCGNMRKIVSWHHPHSGDWHQLNLILAQYHLIQQLKLLHSADCETDHALALTKIHLTKPKKANRGTLDHKPKKTVSTLTMKDCVILNQFEKDLGCALNAPPPTFSSSDSWNSLQNVVYKKAVETCGFCGEGIPDWFKAH